MRRRDFLGTLTRLVSSSIRFTRLDLSSQRGLAGHVVCLASNPRVMLMLDAVEGVMGSAFANRLAAPPFCRTASMRSETDKPERGVSTGGWVFEARLAIV